MYDIGTRKRALVLVSQGRSLNSVSKETGISRAAIRSWQHRIEPRSHRGLPCPRCEDPPRPPEDQAAYAYLLGLYLGDGYIVQWSGHRSPSLAITCDDSWPGLMDECELARRAVFPDNSVCRARKIGCHDVKLYSNHLRCLFPQHGPGKKHERLIALAPWQQAIVDSHPWQFIRGLVHSDGCRMTNWTTRLIPGQKKRYEYPRYFFTNLSDDIRKLYTDTLDKVGVDWKQANFRNISVARKASVALMDVHVGPKH